MIGALEGHDTGLARCQKRRPERNLHRVLAAQAELGRARQRVPQADGRLGLGQIAQRVHHPLLADRRHHAGIAMPQRRDAEAGREIEVLAPLAVGDAATPGTRPDHCRPILCARRET